MPFEEVVVPQGTFIGWGEVGQQVVGHVLSYSETEGSDFNGEPCPLVVIALTEAAINYRNKGTEKETINSGEVVSITCGQANLRRSVRAAALDPGNLVKIVYSENYKTGKGDGKGFKVFVDRSATRATVSSSDLV